MPHDLPDESLLADLLADWESSGGVASAEELCRDRPELLPAVREGMARLRRVNRLIGPLVDDDGTPPTSPLPAGSLPGDLTPGAVLGPFTILGLLGRGGMGAVYLADQRRPKRKVALKLIRGSVGGFGVDAGLLKRFEREADVLALLSHPNIARVYEAAILQTPTGPLPYFAMELVEGAATGASTSGDSSSATAHQPALRIDEYARQKGLPRDDRIRLLIKVCHAVQHAHGKGVIHRDLKPANILVTPEGEPKVLDFGVARVIQTDAVTPEATLTRQTEAIIGTLQYMSPEQASGKSREVDTASDVYALGVIAYQLLSDGRLPYEVAGKPVHEAARLVCEQEPTSLSGTDRSLRGDVETVVLKALEKDKTRRYPTANAFAEDLRRILDSEPIAARRPSTWYQARKFARRNKGLVAGLAAAFAILIAGIVVSSWFAVQANRQRVQAELARTEANKQEQEAQKQKAEAERKAAESEAVTNFINENVLANATPESIPDKAVRDTIVKVMLEPAAKAVREQFQDQPLVQAALMNQIGLSFDLLGRYEEAEPLFRDALERLRRAIGDDGPDTIESLHNLASVLLSLGRAEEAEPLFLEALERSRRVLGPHHPDTITSINNYASVRDALGYPADAELLFKDALEQRRKVLGDDHRDTIASMRNYGSQLRSLGRAADAEPILSEALRASRRILGNDHRDTVLSINNYAQILDSLGRSFESEALHKEALDWRRKVLGDEHPDTITSVNNYATVLHLLGRSGDALPLFKDALERRRRSLGDQHPNTIQSINNCAVALRSLGRHAEAALMFREALDRRRQLLDRDHPHLITSINNYANILEMLGQPSEAASLYCESLEACRRRLGESHPTTMIGTNNYASVLRTLGRPAEAEPFARSVVEWRRREQGNHHPDTLVAVNNYALTLQSMGWFSEAETLLSHLLDRRREVLGKDHDDTITAVSNYASILEVLNRSNDAEPLHKLVFEKRQQVLGENHPRTIMSINKYAGVLLSMGRSAEAEELARRAVSKANESTSLGPGHPNTLAFARTLAGILVANKKPDEARAIAAEFGLPDPTTQPGATQPTTPPLDEAHVAEIRAFVAKLEAEWAEQDRRAATQPAQ